MADTVTVDIREGTLRGRKVSTKGGKTYYSFQGIPYAKPPLGPLRFKVAQPLEPWSGVRDALKEGSPCTQFDMITDVFHGTEDCLYVNVYSPKIPSSGSEKLQLPVMVWIHGGGFMSSSGSADIYGPDYLVEEGVLLVTFNYRLAILGFLSLDDPVATGNIGLKDQVTVLRWVQKNISKFGGDPNNVTIFGESAGGASVHYHMLSPMSKGLFNRAIAQSGSALCPWAFKTNPRPAALRTAKALGFQGEKAEDLLEFLRTIDDMTLVKVALEHGPPEEEKEYVQRMSFLPVVEVEAEGVERFLHASPTELMEQGRYHALPYMTGITEKEGLFSLGVIDNRKPEIAKRTEVNFDIVILPDLRLPKNYNKGDVISKIRSFFLKDKPVSIENLDGMFDLLSDSWFFEPVHFTLKKMAEFGHAPVYNYMFTFDGKANFLKIVKKIEFPGACHADELAYLFSTTYSDIIISDGSPEANVRTRIVKLWTNFAKTGNPTPGGDSQLPLTWLPYTSTNPNYLEINEELSAKKNLLKERVEFWEEIYRT